MGLPRQDVEFRACDGIVLRGFLYDQEETSPCIIMTHGLGGTRHFLLPPFAEAFQDAGYVVLLYDNRNWGDSDGLPRQESNPPLQQADYYDAFNYASSLPFVDKDKIVYWGTSFSGGNVIHAAAVDKRIKAAIIQCPAVSGETRSIAFKDRIPTLLEDRRQITSGSEPPTIPLVAADRESADPAKTNAMFPTKDAYDVINLQNDCGSRWGNFITSQTQLHMLLFEGQAMIHRISPTPLLFVVPGNDVLVKTEYQMDAFNKASEPKQLLYLDGCGHFDLYVGGYFKQNIKAQIEFLDRHVKSQSS
ncbi:alpha beta hydrolase superfamily hydrolase [Fusarium globosum]|uniref:Alpha beta hydrolase superfamily hydrolase n=1 Tax=Fusarium globosum TaxID=78864 RepID=A0A8H5Z099_9HYPO|nr:alpha beta hydrolase superfamily hydrolase [Fusarium globosum]